MRLFENYFKLPFKLDDWGNYVWDSEMQMVFTFDEDAVPENVQKELIKIFNNERDTEGDQVFDFEEENLLMNGDYIGCIRGWGYLTRLGGLNLSDEIAKGVQDDLAKYILERLTKQP